MMEAAFEVILMSDHLHAQYSLPTMENLQVISVIPLGHHGAIRWGRDAIL